MVKRTHTLHSEFKNYLHNNINVQTRSTGHYDFTFTCLIGIINIRLPETGRPYTCAFACLANRSMGRYKRNGQMTFDHVYDSVSVLAPFTGDGCMDAPERRVEISLKKKKNPSVNNKIY